MQLSEFDFPFDPTLIASEPIVPRDQAKLLVLQPAAQSLSHRRMADLPDLLSPGDLLVVNDTRVRSARVIGKKQPSGAAVDMLFVKELADRTWEVLVKGKMKPGQIIDVGSDTRVVIRSRDGERTVVEIESRRSAQEFFKDFGQMPLPPYIKRLPTDRDREWYQTVFAGEEGAIAAPTAGLHFTPQLLARFTERGIGIAKVTLHVGVATFKPVTVERIEEHQMGAEWVDVDDATVRTIARTKKAGNKVVAVGTTVVRALESAARQGALKAYQRETSLFITPGFSFRVTDALMTNFHLPKTTLLMLVSAFAGTDFLRRAYEEAVEQRYRFYSYGDAMYIADVRREA